MGKIVSNFFISLDNVVESPDKWHFGYFDDEMGAVVGRGVANTRAFLMGRKLYDEWSQYWPGQTEDFGAFINSVPKYVLSVLLTFFIFYYNFRQALEGHREVYVNSLRVLGASRVALFRHLTIPLLLPFGVASARIAATVALLSVDELIGRVEAVTSEDVTRLATQLVEHDPVIVGLGPIRDADLDVA